MTEPVMVGGAPAETGNKRAFILLGVAAVLIVLVLVLPKLLFGGGDEAADEPDDLPVVTAGEQVEQLEDQAVAVAPSERFSAKDPFEPLIDVAAAAPDAGDGSIAAVPSDVAPLPVVPIDEAPSFVPFPDVQPAPAPSAAAAPVPPSPAPAPAAAPSVAPVPAAVVPTVGASSRTERIALFEISVDGGGRTVASVRLNGVTSEVGEGDVFGTGFRVVKLSVTDGCGEFLHGNTGFRLCEGVEKLT